jgi:citrate lyase gamma subunit
MALPILETATFELTLPSSDVQVKFRPFQVKEEKVLLQALESQKQKQIVQALKDIISVCTFGQLNVDELPTFDLEYVFLQIRSKSVGEIANLKVLCPDDKSTYADVSIDISEVEVHVDDQHTNKIMVDEAKNISIIMKYPTIASIDPTKDYSKGADTKVLFEMIGKGIYQISEGEKVHMATDYTKEELDKFIESIPSGAFKQIQKFYETMPKLRHELEVENPKTKVKSKITLQGLTDFFG